MQKVNTTVATGAEAVVMVKVFVQMPGMKRLSRVT